MDSPNNMSWFWPYNPSVWEYNEKVLENQNHPGGFAFYRRDSMEYVANEPGRRRFIKPFGEGLVALFVQQ